MQKQLKLKIITPEKLIIEEMVDQVTLPTTEGEITILPDHIPLIASLSSGDIVAYSNGEHIPSAVVGGFLEVKKDEKGDTSVVVLADFAISVSELTEERVVRAKERAEELRKKMDNKEVVDFERFSAELERSLNSVKIANKWRTRKYRK